jgi:hypothetical protein
MNELNLIAFTEYPHTISETTGVSNLQVSGKDRHSQWAGSGISRVDTMRKLAQVCLLWLLNRSR